MPPPTVLLKLNNPNPKCVSFVMLVLQMPRRSRIICQPTRRTQTTSRRRWQLDNAIANNGMTSSIETLSPTRVYHLDLAVTQQWTQRVN
eukprot:m.167359 g.167359  ORF g.167359 m.167359 type:complete len:89 (+) comp31460_c5_seq7:4540-4806(+)